MSIYSYIILYTHSTLDEKNDLFNIGSWTVYTDDNFILFSKEYDAKY